MANANAVSGIRAGGVAKPSTSGKVKVETTWEFGKDGSAVLRFPPEFVQALRTGALSLSTTGKTATPVYVTVQPLTVERDGHDVEFRCTFGANAPVNQTAAVGL